MNTLSKAIKSGHYPKSMVVSEKEAVSIREHFHTNWNNRYDTLEKLRQYRGSFAAYYNTKNGTQKKCSIYLK